LKENSFAIGNCVLPFNLSFASSLACYLVWRRAAAASKTGKLPTTRRRTRRRSKVTTV